MRRSLPFFFLAVLACGPSALRDEGTTPTLSLGGDSSRRIETLTDLEEIRDVAVTSDAVWVATDAGLLRYASGGEAAGELFPGLPSDDVRGIVEDDGALIVATAAGLVRVNGTEVAPIEGVPDVGYVTDLARAGDGTKWICGLGGLARSTADGWEAFGEPVHCTTLAPTPEGHLWVGTDAGLWYVEGDVIREHPISGGMPDGYVRSIVPVLPGKIMAILQGPTDAKIGYWDGERWYAYTLRGLSGGVVGLVRRGRDVILVSNQRAVALAPSGQGVPLVPLSSTQGTVRSFRPSTTPAAEHRAAPAVRAADVLKAPKSIAEVPENLPSVAAPPFVARPLEVSLPGRVYASFADEGDAFLAIANGGVLRVPANGQPRVLRSLTLVPEEDLQVATDSARTVWVLSRDRHLTKLVDGRLVRSPLPEGLVAQAIATGPQGAYLVALEPATPNAVRIFQNLGQGWQPLAQRTLVLATPLVSVPFMGVAPDGKVWIAVRVQREEGEGARVRGVAVIDPSSEAVVYHHRGADSAAGGLPVPDEVSSIEFDTDGNAWLASLSGLVRVGSHQAVVFGEARGVRGEVVTDAVLGNGVVWLASAEGLGSYDRTRFDYAQPGFVQEARPTQLATDLRGTLWAASGHGLVLHEGEDWRIIDDDDGLPVTELRDVETDGAGRVWLLAADRVMILAQ